MQATNIAGASPGAALGIKRVWVGRVLSGLAILFLAFDGVFKLLQPEAVLESARKLGYPESSMVGIGVVLLACVICYAIPRLSIVGAILLTGYLGGAIATHVRVEDPLLSHTLFPIYVAVVIWGGLYLRDERVRQMLRSSSKR